MKTRRTRISAACRAARSAEISSLSKFFAAVALLALAGCSRGPLAPGGTPSAARGGKNLRPARDEFSVMTYNLAGFAFTERNGSGRPAEFKPDAEVQAEFSIIAGAAPDVLVCQEIGDAAAFQKFRDGLKNAGLNLPHAEHLVIAGEATHLALLSRFPIVAHDFVTNEIFTIAGNQHTVEHGFLCADIQVNESYRFKIVAVHLRSKKFVASGQTEMRRNEARLLNKTVRHFLRDKPGLNLLVAGDLSDSPKSAAIRTVIGEPPVIADLCPADSDGAAWTHLVAAKNNCERNDFILCNSNMVREAVAEKWRVVEDSSGMKASDHRPVIAVFRAQDL